MSKQNGYSSYKATIEIEKRKLLQFNRNIPENKDYLSNRRVKALYYYINEFIYDSEIKAAAEFLDQDTIDNLYKIAMDKKNAILENSDYKNNMDDVLIINYQEKANSFIKAAIDKAADLDKAAPEEIKAAQDKAAADIKKKTTDILLLKYFNLNSMIDTVNRKLYPDIKEIDWNKNDLLHPEDIINVMKLFYRELSTIYNVHLDVIGNKKSSGIAIVKFFPFDKNAFKIVAAPDKAAADKAAPEKLSSKELLKKVASLKDSEFIAAPDIYINSIVEITKKIAADKKVEFIKAAIEKLNSLLIEYENSPEIKAAQDKAADKKIVDKAAADLDNKAAQDKAAD